MRISGTDPFVNTMFDNVSIFIPSYHDIQHEYGKIWLKADAYLKNNFCCYIELLRDIKNIMSEEIYILEINDIKYLIFKNNYKQI